MTSRRILLVVGPLVVAATAVAGLCRLMPRAAGHEAIALPSQAPWELSLAGGQAAVFKLTLAAGQFLELVVDQRGVDVVATLSDPAGRELLRVDSPIGELGPETLLACAELTGEHRLEVRAFAGQETGRLQVRIATLRPATAGDRLRAEAARVFAQGEALRRQKSLDEAAQSYRRALRGWQAVGDSSGQAEACDRLGRVHARPGLWRQAIEFHQQALSLFRDAGDRRRQSMTEVFLAQALRALGETGRALAAYEAALDLRRQAGDAKGEAVILSNLGLTYRRLGEIQAALDFYGRALERLRQLGDRRAEAKTLHNLGVLHLDLGRERRALDYLEAAEQVWAELDDPGSHGATLDRLGQLCLRRGEPDRALEYLGRALELRRRAGDRGGRAVTLSNIALVRQVRGEHAKALALDRQALEIFVALGDLRGQGKVLRHLAAVHGALGRPHEALAYGRQSLDLYRRLREPSAEADVLAEIAGVERRLGALDDARRSLEAALGIDETLRLKALGQDLRSSYFATLQDRYGAYADLLMELHRQRPAAGYEAMALAASEQARARSLLEMVHQARAQPRHDADPELVARARSVQEQLNATERLRWLDGERLDEQDLAAIDKKLRELAEELHEVRARLQTAGDGSRRLAEVEPLDAGEIRRQVLDEDTLLLEFELGAERSFLWLVSSARLATFELPPRDAIERSARGAYHFLVRSHRRESAAATHAALCELSRLLLAPAAGELGHRRLAVVVEGGLRYIPFAALPDPAALAAGTGCLEAPPLIRDHEIVHLPSASVLAVLRRELAGRPPPAGAVAVLADPVFDASDPRVRGVATAAGAALEGGVLRAVQAYGERQSFKRLPLAQREAAAILGLAPAGESFQALGFAASKATATGGRLAGYRILHFATHGVLNARQPELSSLVLSRVDERGRPQDGWLRAHEIYDLELRADLVVLSACGTALGQEVRGEGLVGLTQSFIQAGAARVVVSLWNVSDPATAELMERFYRHLLVDGLRPAAALRQAQLAMWRRERWRAPYYWAGFVLQGDWK